MKIKFLKILIYIFLIYSAFIPGGYADNSSGIAVTVTISEVASGVVIPPANQSGDSGQTLTYTFIVKNNGNAQDSYGLKVTSSNRWKTDLPQGDTAGPLNPGQQQEVDVNLIIPKNASANEEDILTLKATSLSDSSVSGSANVFTTVNQIASVKISVSPKDKRARPGQAVNLRASIRNTGNRDDNFKLAASSSLGWLIEFPQGDTIGPIKPGRREAVPITVTVPVDAIKGERDTVTITATSQLDPSVSDSSSSAIIVR